MVMISPCRPADRQRTEHALLNFKFWLDEPGLDAMCYFTENHQILFQVAAYLTGQLWPDAVFLATAVGQAASRCSGCAPASNYGYLVGEGQFFRMGSPMPI